MFPLADFIWLRWTMITRSITNKFQFQIFNVFFGNFFDFFSVGRGYLFDRREKWLDGKILVCIHFKTWIDSNSFWIPLAHWESNNRLPKFLFLRKKPYKRKLDFSSRNNTFDEDSQRRNYLLCIHNEKQINVPLVEKKKSYIARVNSFWYAPARPKHRNENLAQTKRWLWNERKNVFLDK